MQVLGTGYKDVELLGSEYKDVEVPGTEYKDVEVLGTGYKPFMHISNVSDCGSKLAFMCIPAYVHV